MHITRPHGLFLLLFLLIGCSQEGSQTPDKPEAAEPVQLLTDGWYQAAGESVLELAEASGTFTGLVGDFIARPDPDTLGSCREAWLLLHQSFIELDFYFHDALRSDRFRDLVFNIHAWPLEPGFIDSLPEYPTSGIINDLTLELNKASLNQQHAATSAEEISLGLHAVEYFLWQRPLRDFQSVLELSEQQVANGMVPEQLSNNRRRLALTLMSDALREDLSVLQTLLAAEQKLKGRQMATDPLNAIHQALKQSLYELTLIRSIDQQNHSAFSQSSLQNILGRIELIHKSNSDDTNLPGAVRSRDEKLGTEFQQALAKTLEDATNLQPDDSDGMARLAELIALLDRHIQEIRILLDN